jgi:hypothetical protein
VKSAIRRTGGLIMASFRSSKARCWSGPQINWTPFLRSRLRGQHVRQIVEWIYGKNSPFPGIARHP